MNDEILREFCQAMKCQRLAKSECKALFGVWCLYTTKAFNEWLHANGYRIVKEDCNHEFGQEPIDAPVYECRKCGRLSK